MARGANAGSMEVIFLKPRNGYQGLWRCPRCGELRGGTLYGNPFRNIPVRLTRVRCRCKSVVAGRCQERSIRMTTRPPPGYEQGPPKW
ncbi:MAG: hypothetical protein ACRDO9_03190 [Gaiellales bacterium]